VAPVADSVADDPAHIVVKEGVIVSVGIGITLTVPVAELVQVPVPPITVYVVVTVGDAFTLAVLVLLSDATGLQV
jgi:hypothetical protein